MKKALFYCINKLNKIAFYLTIVIIIVWLFVTVMSIISYGLLHENSLAAISIAISFFVLLIVEFSTWIKETLRRYYEMKQAFLQEKKKPMEIPEEMKKDFPMMNVFEENLLEDYQRYLTLDLLFHYKAPQELIEKWKN